MNFDSEDEEEYDNTNCGKMFIEQVNINIDNALEDQRVNGIDYINKLYSEIVENPNPISNEEYDSIMNDNGILNILFHKLYILEPLLKGFCERLNYYITCGNNLDNKIKNLNTLIRSNSNVQTNQPKKLKKEKREFFPRIERTAYNFGGMFILPAIDLMEVAINNIIRCINELINIINSRNFQQVNNNMISRYSQNLAQQKTLIIGMRKKITDYYSNMNKIGFKLEQIKRDLNKKRMGPTLESLARPVAKKYIEDTNPNMELDEGEKIVLSGNYGSDNVEVVENEVGGRRKSNKRRNKKSKKVQKRKLSKKRKAVRKSNKRRYK